MGWFSWSRPRKDVERSHDSEANVDTERSRVPECAKDPDRVVEFERSLDETLLWCRPRFSMYDLENSLRSPELKPPPVKYEGLDLDIVSLQAMEVVKTGRREQVHGNEKDLIVDRCASWGLRLIMDQESEDTLRHRLLAMFPDESLSYGTSFPPTGGFLDDDDVPPWDTWIYYEAGMLVTLVPPELVSAVEEAIRLSGDECIGWLGYIDHPLVDELRRARLPGIRLEVPSEPPPFSVATG